jgi:Predicted nucleotide-binding protein containing TIR-like domain
MVVLPVSLYDRCRKLLVSECRNELDSNESVKNIFSGTEFAGYSMYFHDQKNPDDRIDEVIRELKDRRYKGKSVLAKFLEVLAQRSYPEDDDTKTNLIQLAQEIQVWMQAHISSSHPTQPVPDSHDSQQTSEDEKSKQVLVIWGHDEAAGIEMFQFLSGANLSLVKWSQVEARVEKNDPSVDETLHAAFDTAQAVIVVFTSDYLAKLKSAPADQDVSVKGKNLHFHPKLDLLFIAGLAFNMDQERTILVALGNMRFSHTLLEQHIIYLTNDDKDRRRLMTRLQRAHCKITDSRWQVQGNFYEPRFS